MFRFFCLFLGGFLRVLLSLRYRIQVKNIQAIFDAGYHKKGGVLFLPNHPAEVDPLILNTLLMNKFRPRPLVIEYFYHLKGAHFFMKWVRAFPIPNFEVSTNTWKIKQIEKTFENVSKAIRRGDNFLIYPSGQLKSGGSEVIGGSSFVHRILKVCPDVKIVLIRTTGLWGSTFSRAITGRSPDFWKVLLHGFKILLKNGFFFTPRRDVTVEFSLASHDFPYRGARIDLNRYLENWYNQYRTDAGHITDKEPLKFVSFSRFSEDIPQIIRQEKNQRRGEKIQVPEAVRKQVFQELSRLSSLSLTEINDDSDLAKDLALDSLDYANIQVFLDERYDVSTIVPERMQTVADLFSFIIEGKPKGESVDFTDPKLSRWPEETFRPAIHFLKGETIQEVFLNTCDRMKKNWACGDELTKFLTYRQFKMSVIVLAQQFEKMPDLYIGILLPSSVGAFILVLAILMARKIPVMLNWTAGARSLNFADELLGLQTVFSARRFLERVDSLELGSIEDKLILMEDFRKKLSFWDKFKGLYLGRKNKSVLMKRFKLNRVQREDPAVILFTSGTETYPKAVPLSHHNLITNQNAALESVKINRDDILLGVLPPFHSFGFSVAGLFPLLSGVRVFFSPDPTDSYKMARDCDLRGITLLCSAPSFYQNLFRVATPHQLRSVRIFVSGAEKAPKELFDSVKKLKGNPFLVEGYGITECSPIVTICRLGQPSKGVGQPLPNIDLCIIDPQTEQRLSNHEEGEVCIKGPSVFSGYMGEGEIQNPFVEIEGKKWYRSGDLGSIDADGSLLYKGRIKRFVKIAGEMVSLGALEEELVRVAKEKRWISKDEQVPQLAIGVMERESDKPLLTLFTTFDVSSQQVNRILRDLGFGRIVKIQDVRRIPEIPMTGTGKVQLRRINQMVKETSFN